MTARGIPPLAPLGSGVICAGLTSG